MCVTAWACKIEAYLHKLYNYTYMKIKFYRISGTEVKWLSMRYQYKKYSLSCVRMHMHTYMYVGAYMCIFTCA